MAESYLVRRIRMRVKELAYHRVDGPILLNNHGSGHEMKGRPDLELCWKGRLIFIEVKVAGGKLSPAQEVAHCNLERAGMDVRVVRSLEEFGEILEELRNDNSNQRITGECSTPGCRWCGGNTAGEP